MDLIKGDGDHLVFHLSKRQKRLLLDLLKLYPLVPASYHQITKNSNPPEKAEAQQLLDEAIAEQKTEARRQLASLIEKEKMNNENYLRLTNSQVEWLLQVLNDIRVGSWLQVGCPDPQKGKKPRLTTRNAHLFMAMELSGYFLTALLKASENTGDRG